MVFVEASTGYVSHPVPSLLTDRLQSHGSKGDVLGSPAQDDKRKELVNQFGLTEEVIRLLVDLPGPEMVAERADANEEAT